MDFGVVFQLDPPASDVVRLAQRAEAGGFSHVWTFDSHLLWQEPFVIYSQILASTSSVTVGPMVTNPATRDLTVTASLFATLNSMYGDRTICGIGRGDSALRTLGFAPTTLAQLTESVEVIRGLASGRTVRYRGADLHFPWVTDGHLDVWVAAYGPKALAVAGTVGDGYILQLADVDIAAWMIKTVKDAAAAAGRDPEAHERERLAKDHPQHGLRRRSQSYADADFARPLRGAVRHHSVHAYPRQKQSEKTHGAGLDRAYPQKEKALRSVHGLCHGLKTYRHHGVERMDFPLHTIVQCLGIHQGSDVQDPHR